MLFPWFSVIQLLSRVQLFATPGTAARQASLSITNTLSLLTKTHVHWVGHAIQPSHPLSSPSPPAFNLSQHQGLFWVGSFLSGGQSIAASASASVLTMNIEGWFPLVLTGLISLQSRGLSRVFSNSAVQKHQFLGAQFPYGLALTSIHDYWKKHSFA